jgi:hypothetical protein
MSEKGAREKVGWKYDKYHTNPTCIRFSICFPSCTACQCIARANRSSIGVMTKGFGSGVIKHAIDKHAEIGDDRAAGRRAHVHNDTVRYYTDFGSATSTCMYVLCLGPNFNFKM